MNYMQPTPASSSPSPAIASAAALTAATAKLPPDLMTIEQAAAYLQMSHTSIRAYMRQGKLKPFKVAGLRRAFIPREELMKLLEPVCEEDLPARRR